MQQKRRTFILLFQKISLMISRKIKYTPIQKSARAHAIVEKLTNSRSAYNLSVLSIPTNTPTAAITIPKSGLLLPCQIILINISKITTSKPMAAIFLDLKFNFILLPLKKCLKIIKAWNKLEHHFHDLLLSNCVYNFIYNPPKILKNKNCIHNYITFFVFFNM